MGSKKILLVGGGGKPGHAACDPEPDTGKIFNAHIL